MSSYSQEMLAGIRSALNDLNIKEAQYEKCKKQLAHYNYVIDDLTRSLAISKKRLQERIIQCEIDHVKLCEEYIPRLGKEKKQFEQKMEDMECKICFSACSQMFGKCRVCTDCSICASCEKEQIEKFKVCPFCKTKF